MKKFQVWVSIIMIALLAVNIGLYVKNIIMTDSLVMINKQVAQDVKKLKTVSKDIQANEYWHGGSSYVVGQ